MFQQGIKILKLRHRVAPPPGGCRWCGIPFQQHLLQWIPGRGWHQHTTPTEAQYVARLAADRKPLPTIVTNLASDVRTRL